MDDLNFYFGSCIVLPFPHTLDAPEKEHIGGLNVLVRVLQYALDTGQTLLLAGHTDSVGDAGANVELSQARAENVHYFLLGDYQSWAEACENYQVADYQSILNWLADTRGWDCDPGDVDNIDGPKTRGGLKGFRKAYKDAYDEELPDGNKPTKDDWMAFAKLYEESLDDLVDVKTARDNLVFASSPVLACGENWPDAGDYADNIRSAENRRVEFLFFEDSTLPEFAASDPPGYLIYGTDRFYTREYLLIDPAFRFYFSI